MSNPDQRLTRVVQDLNADFIVRWEVVAEDQIQPVDAFPASQLETCREFLTHSAHLEVLQRFLHAKNTQNVLGSRVLTDVSAYIAIAAEQHRPHRFLFEVVWLDSPQHFPEDEPTLLRRVAAAGRDHSLIDTQHDPDPSPSDLDGFCVEIQRSLDVYEAATIVANETCRQCSAERVTVAEARGRRVKLLAVSGVEEIVHRSSQMMALTTLVQSVLDFGSEVTWAQGATETPVTVEPLLADYVQASGVRAITIIPLLESKKVVRDDDPAIPQGAPSKLRAVGALVFEQFRSSECNDLEQSHRRRLGILTQPAFSNAVTHSSIFMRRPLLAIGRFFGWFRGRRRIIAAIVLSLISAFAVCCVVVPWEYKVACDGELVTLTRTDIFAPEIGIVTDIHVRHEDEVAPGQPLLTLRNDELEAQQAVAEARVDELRQLVRSYETQFNEAERRGLRDESIAIQGELARTEIELLGAQSALKLLTRQVEGLNVVAPAAGIVATFQVQELLQNRPVAQGERLLQIYPPEGPWILELRIPEYRTGSVLDAFDRNTEGVEVEFIPATRVELSCRAKLTEISTIVETSESDGTILVVRAEIPEQAALPAMKYGAECHARIHCGKESLGWCLFGEIIQFFQRYFWL